MTKTLVTGIKHYRLLSTGMLFIFLSVLLASCSSGSLVNNWPGVSANQDVVYLSYQSSVYAVNATNGILAWSFPKEKPDASKPFYAAPAFGADGLVVVGNYGQVLYGLDPNGDIRWQFTAERANFSATPLVMDDVILAPASDGYLYALSMTGTERWKYKTGNMLWAQPASDGEMVFLPGLDHALYALRLSDGSLVWKKDLESSLVSDPVWDQNGYLFINTLNGDVLSLKTIDGSVNWQFSTQGTLWSSPLLHENTLFVGSSEGKTKGKVFAISAVDGSKIWEQDAGSPVIGGGAFVSDSVVFPTEGGNLSAWSIVDGTSKWAQSIGGKLYSTPVIVGDKLVTAVYQGEGKILQAVSFDGQTQWSFALPK